MGTIAKENLEGSFSNNESLREENIIEFLQRGAAFHEASESLVH